MIDYIDISRINYFLINNLNVIINYDNTKKIFSYDNVIELQVDLRSLQFHKQLATIGNINGTYQIVNVANVLSYSHNADELTINFNNDSTIINCLDEIDAENNYNYLNFCWNNYSPLERALQNKTAITVNLNASLSATNYHTIQDAINYISDMASAIVTNYVHISAGTYNEHLTLKSGIDLFFEDDTFFNDDTAGNTMTDNNQALLVNIYGNCSFTKSSSGYLIKLTSIESIVNFSFDKIQCDETIAYIDTGGVTNGSILRMKGNRMISSNSSLISCDGSIDVIDIDVITCIAPAVLFGSQKSSNQYRYFRNGHYINTGSDMIVYSDSTSGHIQQYDFVINCMAETDGLYFLQTESLDRITMWYSIIRVSDSGFVIEIFNDNYNRTDIHNLFYVSSNADYTDGESFYHGVFTKQPITTISNGYIEGVREGNLVTLQLASIPFAQEYYIFNREELINISQAHELEYSVTVSKQTKDNFDRFRYRGKLNSTYSEYSNSFVPHYFKGAQLT